MSIERCEKHDRRFDTDFVEACPSCVEEEVKEISLGEQRNELAQATREFEALVTVAARAASCLPSVMNDVAKTKLREAIRQLPVHIKDRIGASD